MKIAITGHTKGIGRAIAAKAQTLGHTIVGLSRSNGFDISDTEKVFNEIKKCDAFVNNAYMPVYQTKLLELVLNNWKRNNLATVINISSKLSYLEPPYRNLPADYIEDKKQQNKLMHQFSILGTPRILNVVLGIVDTDMTAHWNVEKMKTHAVADTIFNTLTMTNPLVQEIVFDVPYFNWKAVNTTKEQ